MHKNRSGYNITQGDYKAYIPKKLASAETILVDRELVRRAETKLSLLNTFDTLLPNRDLFVTIATGKEALYSCQIEGTQASLEDIFDTEAGILVHNQDDVAEVINYIRALKYGTDRLESLPVSLRLIKELHRILLKGTGGADKSPGEFRRSQNWIGPAGCTLFNATYVPPPPHLVTELMGELETYFHTSDSLIDCALIHYQFETIHPFLDGNGRLGRLLITFYLQWKNRLQSPLLYLSYYLKRNRQEYYDRLTMVRTTGNYEQWVAFFLRGIIETSNSAVSSIQKILQLQEKMRTLLITKQASINALKLLNSLYYVPIISITDAQRECRLSFQAASNLVHEFETYGILSEITGKKRSKRYSFKEYIDLLSEGTEPL